MVGNEPGAPAQPRLLAKVLVTTFVSLFVTWGVAWFLKQRLNRRVPPAPQARLGEAGRGILAKMCFKGR